MTAITVSGRRESGAKIALYVAGFVLSVIVFAAPLLFALFRAFQPAQVIENPPDGSTFFHLTWQNFAHLGSEAHLGEAILNSAIVAVVTAVLTAVLSTLAGYGFAKFRFRVSNWLFGLIVLTMMVPFQAILTPLYLELNSMHLTNSLLGLILFYTTVNLPFGVFVMRNAFESIPPELEDSGFVDGAGTTRMLLSVLRPLILPGAATAALYAFLASWTEFLGALTFLTNAKLYTLPLALVNVQQGAYGQVDFGLLAAGAVVAMIPCIVLYVGMQRFYVAGLASGAVKG
ncbi:carbohydrate ABC transporter permease [Gryllotalpicola ginsengisoli]|uniref:carbohydrate ABC transporter permease n=1 Tax=Gryllotalpicola ginsengisoli TaxID=444608 RepID=UPI0003B3F129|nr:carbohydrate ABC transporter permease [Gryllotalpicola ginsengisoli]